MKPAGTYRDVDSVEPQLVRDAPAGRSYIAVIGIDRYRVWNRLYNAVSDANGALKLFSDLGFELIAQPLFDEGATGDALRRLVVDDLSGLSGDDSLVLFFAGHGHTVKRTYDGATVRDGYLIPADGEQRVGRAATWIRLDSWLTEIARIPARHILVILDACHSGLALGPVLQWRSRGMEHARREPLEQLRARRSRRIITSALDDQSAMDGGPVPGHSLFTGCLIEAITGGLMATTGHRVVTGSEIGHYVQRRVSEYPGSTQTPDFGALELDDRGEMVVQLPGADSVQSKDSTALAAGQLRLPAKRPDERYISATQLVRAITQLGVIPVSAVSRTETASTDKVEAAALTRDTILNGNQSPTHVLRHDGGQSRIAIIAAAATLAIVIVLVLWLLARHSSSDDGSANRDQEVGTVVAKPKADTVAESMGSAYQTLTPGPLNQQMPDAQPAAPREPEPTPPQPSAAIPPSSSPDAAPTTPSDAGSPPGSPPPAAASPPGPAPQAAAPPHGPLPPAAAPRPEPPAKTASPGASAPGATSGTAKAKEQSPCNCTVEWFASIYESAKPVPAALQTALDRLSGCKDQMDASDYTFVERNIINKIGNP